MVYNYKLAGALLVLAFLACLFMVSSAENIHEQPLSDTPSEGGLKTSPNDALKNGIIVAQMHSYNPTLCVYSFANENGSPCKLPVSSSKPVTCLLQRLDDKRCPKISDDKVKMLFSKKEGEYQLEMKDVPIEDLPAKFNSKVKEIKVSGKRRQVIFASDFHGYTIHAFAL
eukprot:Nk52_evm15s237 gene=Nk52_evmTU15s237